MPLRIPVAHDFTCGWCWIGLSQVKRLRAEFDVEFEWLPFELYPEGTPFPQAPPPVAAPSDRPKTPGRLRLAYAAEGLEVPDLALPDSRTHRAHQLVELAKRYGRADEMVDRIYGAYWKHGLDIGNPAVLLLLAKGLIPDEEVAAALETIPDRERFVHFDDDAHRAGVFNVPTFFLGGERYAEQPYSVLRRAVAAELGVSPEPRSPYRSLAFPKGPAERPYVAINMVATIDGKIISGTRSEPVGDLGSAVDKAVLRQIEHAVQAVMIGAATLRATPGLWYPPHLTRIVVTSSGSVNTESRFFTDVPEKAFVVLPEGVEVPWPHTLSVGRGEVDLGALLRLLKAKLGVETLVVEGGSELNAQLLAADQVDEMFLTIAPKVKLGRDTPTVAGGKPLPREHLLQFSLIEEHRVADEVFLRYRRRHDVV